MSDCLSPWRRDLATFDLKQYALRGAQARVQELQQELTAIYRAFPGLRRGGCGAVAVVRRRRQAAGRFVVVSQ